MVEIKQDNKNYKYTLYVVSGAILISILIAFFIGRPLYNGIQSTGQELKIKDETLRRLEEKLTALKKLESIKTELEEKNEKVIAALPDDKGIARLFYQFEAIAAESGVMINSVSEVTNISSAAKEGENREIIPVNYRVTATTDNYANLKTALDGFEKSLRILSIDSVKVSKTNNEIKINFEINTYKRGN